MGWAMPEIAYESWSPSTKSQELVHHAQRICLEYVQSGYDLTLRQLYYQFVSRDLIPNNQRSYKNLGGVINRARMAGLLDWSYIVDRTRNLKDLPHWASAGSVLRSAANGFMLDRWKDQPYRIEVWIEKDALTGVIEGVCDELDVPFFSCRGYTSQSELWRAARRQHDYHHAGQEGVVIHLGDHDPSGIDMTRDIIDRMHTFGAFPEMRRIALNWDQVQAYDPPPNPAKLSDSRAESYIYEFGSESWELDALEPAVMNDLIRDTIYEYRDVDVHDETMVKEQGIIDGLTELAAAPWDKVREAVQAIK